MLTLSTREIIRTCGGDEVIAARIGITAAGVRFWIASGIIAEEHWSTLIDLAEGELGLRDLHAHNQETRRRRAQKGQQHGGQAAAAPQS